MTTEPLKLVVNQCRNIWSYSEPKKENSNDSNYIYNSSMTWKQQEFETQPVFLCVCVAHRHICVYEATEYTPVKSAVHCKSFDLWQERGPLMRMLTVCLAGKFLGGLELIRTHWLRQCFFCNPQTVRKTCTAFLRPGFKCLWASRLCALGGGTLKPYCTLHLGHT